MEYNQANQDKDECLASFAKTLKLSLHVTWWKMTDMSWSARSAMQPSLTIWRFSPVSTNWKSWMIMFIGWQVMNQLNSGFVLQTRLWVPGNNLDFLVSKPDFETLSLRVWQKATKIIIHQQFNDAATWPFGSYDTEECAGVRFGLNLADVWDGLGSDNDWANGRYSCDLMVEFTATTMTTTLESQTVINC
jgi:hypothetical protein